MEPTTDSGTETAHFGRYEIIAKLATGGMGEVFVARSVGAAGFQKHVVIKKILPHLVEQQSIVEALVNEAKLLVRMDHPNIVQVLDLGMEGNNYFMAMEYVQGYPVANIVGYCAKHKLVIPPTICAQIVAEMLLGLEYIHELTEQDGTPMHIVHRDVSPQNVLISREGRVKLADFGIAKVLREAEGALTQSLKGKLKYMAPEALEEGRIDRRYDLFASGIVLFETLCRAHLYRGKSDAELMVRVREARVPSPSRYHPGLPKELELVTKKALSRDPERRYQTAGEFARALHDAMAPVTQQEAAADLRALVTDLYQREDFPVSLKKLPDLTATPSSASVQPLLLQSKIDAPAADGSQSAQSLTPAPVHARHINPLIILLTVGFIGISVVVGYILYTMQARSGVGPQEKGQVIIVEQHNRRPPVVPPKAVTKPQPPPPVPAPAPKTKPAPAPKAKVVRRPRPVAPAKPFDPTKGAQTFRRYHRGLTTCFNKHTKASDPEIRLRVISTIRGNGRVAEVKLQPPEQNATAVGRCVIKVARRIRYPRHDKPMVSFHQPLRVTRTAP